MSSKSEMEQIVQHIYQKHKDVDDGALATYIPELAKADPEGFGICLATVDGRTICVGDWEHEFTIQSICKPFAFQMALEAIGREETLRHVGVEPSGEAFNSIELEPKTMPPFNPMINAGAIAISSLLKKDPPADAGASRRRGTAEFLGRDEEPTTTPLLRPCRSRDAVRGALADPEDVFGAARVCYLRRHPCSQPRTMKRADAATTVNSRFVLRNQAG